MAFAYDESSRSSAFVACPVCSKQVASALINDHLNSCLEASCEPEAPSRSTAALRYGRDIHCKSTGAQVEALSIGGRKRTASSESELPAKAARRTSSLSASSAPLAERMRPRRLDEFIGQDDTLATFAPLLADGSLPSLILWGPPGCGKTSFATVVEQHATGCIFKRLSAVTCGVAEVRQCVEAAAGARRLAGRRTILFLDEIHRFNKAQQDAFLPHVEQGTITLIGATTENPSFSLNSALLSRCRVVSLSQLTPAQLQPLLSNALTDVERGMGDKGVTAADGVLAALATLADGDARSALNALELAVNTVAVTAAIEPCATEESDILARSRVLTLDAVRKALQKTHLLYDRNGEQHYNIISALHKSMRGSDPDAALYWCGRMLRSGENPRYITRRLIRFASEDVGLADPNALLQAVAADTAAQAIGMPEASVVIGQCVAYLALAPKSVAITRAMAAVDEHIQSHPNEPVPHVIRNAPTKLMKQEGYGSGYIYPPDHGYPVKPQVYLPQSMAGTTFFSMEGEVQCPLIARALARATVGSPRLAD